MFNKIRALASLPFKHQVILCRSWLLFVYWHILISWVPYTKWKHKLNQQPESSSHHSFSDVRQLIKLTETAGRHHFLPVNCLRRCMVQKSLLYRFNVVTQLVIGVKKVDNVFSAHCWLTYNSQVINDSPNVIDQYAVLQKTSKDLAAADVLKGLF